MKDTRKKHFGQNNDAHVNSQRLWQYPQAPHKVQSRCDHISARKVDKNPILNPKDLQVTTSGKGKTSFFKGMSIGALTTFSAAQAQKQMSTPNKLSVIFEELFLSYTGKFVYLNITCYFLLYHGFWFCVVMSFLYVCVHVFLMIVLHYLPSICLLCFVLLWFAFFFFLPVCFLK